MIGVSTPEYVFIRGCIFFLHSIAPISLLYCALLLLHSLLPASYTWRVPILVEVWLVFETIFFLGFYLPHKRHLQHPAIHPEPLSLEERGKLFERCIGSVEDPEKYLGQWHLNANKANIKNENVKEFLRWAFLNTGETRTEDAIELEGYVKSTEKLLGRDIPSGMGSAKSLRLTIDKVDCLYRSLLWYLVRYDEACFFPSCRLATQKANLYSPQVHRCGRHDHVMEDGSPWLPPPSHLPPTILHNISLPPSYTAVYS
jgi:hypothetical protein